MNNFSDLRGVNANLGTETVVVNNFGISTAATALALGAAIVTIIDGVYYTQSAQTVIAFTTGLTTQTADTLCLYGVWAGKTGGDWKVYQGDIVDASKFSAGLVNLPLPPMGSAGMAPVGLLRILVANTAGASFAPGSTALSNANVTDTYYDLFTYPARPFTS